MFQLTLVETEEVRRLVSGRGRGASDALPADVELPTPGQCCDWRRTRRGLSASGIRNARDLHATRAYSETGIMKNEFFEEIWRVREKLAARFDYDLHRMVIHLQRQQAKHGAR